jgi:uncharacterized protein YeaO (DUF488 family)
VEANDTMIRLKRVYDATDDGDGLRFLVDRVWPRGVRKDSLVLDGWLKDVAPSDELRRWFRHDPSRWVGFRRKYFAQLRGNLAACRALLEAASRRRVTLLYGARDRAHNNAMALKEFLESRVAKKRVRGRPSPRRPRDRSSR